MRKPNEIKIGDKTLDVILMRHKLWIDGKDGGVRADLTGANLNNADLTDVDFRRAILDKASLCGAKIEYADMRGVSLISAYIERAEIRNTYLTNSMLCDASMVDVFMRGCYMSSANMKHVQITDTVIKSTDFWHVNLTEAKILYTTIINVDFNETNFSNVYLRGTEIINSGLDSALNPPRIPMACPETGSFIGWKQCVGRRIVELEIPADAKRSSGTTRKCRCDKAFVKSIKDVSGTKEYTEALSYHDNRFVYKVNETVYVPNYCKNRFVNCAEGIHFYTTRQEAVDYIYF